MKMAELEGDSCVSAGARAAYVPPSWRQRLIWALGLYRKHNDELFDWRNMDPPEEGFVPSCLHTETHCILDWKDRLRVLFTGHVVVDVWTKTDVLVKKSKSRSEVAVLPPIRKS